MSPLRVAIIGAGRMGRIRALSASAHPACTVVHVSDVVGALAQSLAAEIGCSSGVDWQSPLERSDVDAVVVATPHKFLSTIASAALRAGKYVFCEKPMARNAHEAEHILNSSAGFRRDTILNQKRSDHQMIVGYTLRHHPAVAFAKRLVAEDAIGEPFCVRGRYGHGGRSGYDKEWRGSVELSGGGELLDQGVHLIDLSRWFLGEFYQVLGAVNSYFWNSWQAPSCVGISLGTLPTTEFSGQLAEVEDNAFMLLRTRKGQTAMLHVSWTQWKNLFSFEVFGPKGFVIVEGLGGSYGQEQLTIARRSDSGGPPEMQQILFNQPRDPGMGICPDRQIDEYFLQSQSNIALQTSCWDEEWADFVRAVRKPLTGSRHSAVINSANVLDGCQNLKIVDAVYESARTGAAVTLNN
jgi:predicted dehydrogenase